MRIIGVPGESREGSMDGAVVPSRGTCRISLILSDTVAPELRQRGVSSRVGEPPGPYLSETFLRACTTLGISVQPARPYTGSDKAVVERTFESINTLFCQHVAGYTGRDTTRRGPYVAEYGRL